MPNNNYILIDRKVNRTEFAETDIAENRFIHSQERKSRKLGTSMQPLFVNNFVVLRNKDMAAPGATIPLYGLTSARLNISSASLVEAKEAWENLKAEVDQIFTEQPHIFKGLPLAVNFNINT